MLTNEEIRELCEKYCLSRGQVYNIRSTYASMCEMSDKWYAEQPANTKVVAGADENVQGIRIEYFIKNCSFLNGTLESISRRIISATGKRNYYS